MAIYLFDPKTFQQLYNCSFYSVDDVPLEKRRHPILGTINIAFFIVAEVSQNMNDEMKNKSTF